MFGVRSARGRMAEGATMIPDLDIYRSAQVLVKRHDEDAMIRATIPAGVEAA